jgi:hypothetical protein
MTRIPIWWLMKFHFDNKGCAIWLDAPGHARQTHPKFDDYNQSGIPGGHRCVAWSALQSVTKATVSRLVGGGR